MNIRIVCLAALALSGCSILPAPEYVSGCTTHVSHPLRGQPFGPKEEEDSLNTVGACTHWERGRVTIDMGLGYSYTDSGFYGDDFVYQGTIGYKLWEKR